MAMDLQNGGAGTGRFPRYVEEVVYLRCEYSSQATSFGERSGRKEPVKMKMKMGMKINLFCGYRSVLRLTVAVACLGMLACKRRERRNL